MSKEKEKKETLQEKVMNKKTVNIFKKRTIGKVYQEDPKSLVINNDLREISEDPMSDPDYVDLYVSIEKNGFDPSAPVVVDKNTGWIVTGNRRTHVSIALGLKEIPVIFKSISKGDYVKYISAAYYLNTQKTSKVSEIAKHIRAMKETGMSAEEISDKWGISQKSVYDVFSVTDSRLTDLLDKGKITLKNAIALNKTPTAFRTDENIALGQKVSEAELKQALKVQRDKVKAEEKAKNGDTEVKKHDVFNNKEQNKMFFVQLANFNGETINTAKLKAFLKGERKDWMR